MKKIICKECGIEKWDNSGLNENRAFIEDFEQLLLDTPKHKIHRLLKSLSEEVEFFGNKKIARGENRGYWKLIQG